MRIVLVLFIGLWLLSPCSLLIQNVNAQKAVKVCGEYTFYAEGNQSLNEAKKLALDGARLDALAREFGTVITQSTLQQETAVGGEEQSYFSQLNASEVQGEWLEDVQEPVYEVNFVQDMLVVKCRVCGRAQPFSNEAVDFMAKVLRNGTDAKFADVHFRNGDDFFLLFQAPTDGYMAVYLIDNTPTAYCLLPYGDDSDGQQLVKHNREYVFFSQDKAFEEKANVDEYTLTCEAEVERNQVYVIFSPHPFTKAVDSRVNEALPRQLSFEEFSKWLVKTRKRDTKMGVKVMHIEIKKE